MDPRRYNPPLYILYTCVVPPTVPYTIVVLRNGRDRVTPRSGAAVYAERPCAHVAPSEGHSAETGVRVRLRGSVAMNAETLLNHTHNQA